MGSNPIARSNPINSLNRDKTAPSGRLSAECPRNAVRQAFTGPPDPGNDHAPDAGNVEGAGRNSAFRGAENRDRDSRPACAAQESNAVPIGRFQKNSREVIRAELRTFKGVHLADLRVMALANTVELPTKAGFSIRVEQLLELADLVARALAEARARGLLDQGGAS